MGEICRARVEVHARLIRRGAGVSAHHPTALGRSSPLRGGQVHGTDGRPLPQRLPHRLRDVDYDPVLRKDETGRWSGAANMITPCKGLHTCKMLTNKICAVIVSTAATHLQVDVSIASKETAAQVTTKLKPTNATTLDLAATPMPKSDSHQDNNILRVAAMGDGSTKNKDVVVWVQLSLRQLNRLHDASHVHAAKVIHELLGDLYAPEIDAWSGKNSWLCHSSITYTCQGAHTLSQRKLHAFEASTQTTPKEELQVEHVDDTHALPLSCLGSGWVADPASAAR